jgi:Methyltransferase FkbM domain
MVEPDPNALAAGKSNFQRNGLIGEFIAANVATGQFEVDAFLHERNLGHVHILHADIQGSEVEMLETAHISLSEVKIDYMFVSTHSQELHSEIVKVLAGYGYRVEVSSDFDNDTTSFDGFVFASSPKLKPLFEEFKPLGRTKIVVLPPAQLVQMGTAMRKVSG